MGKMTGDDCITMGAFNTSGIAFAVMEEPMAGEDADSGILDGKLVPSVRLAPFVIPVTLSSSGTAWDSGTVGGVEAPVGDA
jgi:hypothetical protein